MKRLGLRGASIGGHVNGEDLSLPKFDPFWAKAAELGVPVFMHPGGAENIVKEGAFRGRGDLGNIIGNPLETTYFLSRLIFDGVFDKFPGLRVFAAHAGGYLPSYLGRTEAACVVRGNANCANKKKPSEYLKSQILIDTMVFSDEGLRHLVAEVGVGQVVYGTDVPFNWPVTVDLVLNAKFLSDADKEGDPERQPAKTTADRMRSHADITDFVPVVRRVGGARRRKHERKTLDIYVVDVEGGNATLFVAPSGESVLIDTGNGGAAAARDADRIMAAVKDAGLTQIDHLITTHWHGDHFGAMAELPARIPIRHFIDHGPNVQPQRGDGRVPAEASIRRCTRRAKHTVAKPGDTHSDRRPRVAHRDVGRAGDQDAAARRRQAQPVLREPSSRRTPTRPRTRSRWAA